MREIAQQLLAYETAAADSNSETAVPASRRVLETLRLPLSTLLGVQGCRVLFARALTLARAKTPSLSQVTVQPDASFQGFSEGNAEENSEAGTVLIAQILGLLTTFIGKGLMLRILAGVWPDLPGSGIRDSGEAEL